MATQPTPNEKLVEVFGSKEESEAMVVSGLLETAGINCMVTATDAPQDVLPGVGGVVVKVAAEDADEARQIIEDYRASAESELNSESEEEEPA
jgi:Putative prokaryotic signal transducing protein